VNKSDLIKHVSKHCCGKKEAKEVVESSIAYMAKALSEGDKVVLSGFGSFHVYERKQKRAAHPRKPNEIIIIPAMKCVRFIPGKVIKGSLKS
jgi:DNA-binding protein HU-beta